MAISDVLLEGGSHLRHISTRRGVENLKILGGCYLLIAPYNV